MHYPQWKLMSVDVPPVTVLLQSLQKLTDGLLFRESSVDGILAFYTVCQDPSSSSGGGWLNKLEASGWLSYVTSLLCVVATTVHELCNEGMS